MDTLAGKIAVVTGATRGIGRAIAERFILLGANVVICSRHEADVLEAVEHMNRLGGGKADGMQCDVARYEEVHALFVFAAERFDGVDILVNNAGLPQHGMLKEMMPFPDEWDYIMGVNLMGAVYCAREAIPLMQARGGGWIVNISSLSAHEYKGGNSAYVTSKAGMVAFSQTLMNEVRGDGILVGVILPGTVSTTFGGKLPGHPERRLQAEDVTDAVVAMVTAPGRALTSLVEIRPRWRPNT